VTDEKPLAKNGSIFVGLALALAGVAIVLVSVYAESEKFHAPRWVVGSVGGAFLFFGAWTAALYALGYDPQRPNETLPSPAVQLAVFIPGILLFAAPFHWIAFGPGPRQFSMTFSIPFLSARHPGGSVVGRILFGFGAILVDVLLVATVVRLVRQMERRKLALPPRQQ
jgi:hypothetical protein